MNQTPRLERIKLLALALALLLGSIGCTARVKIGYQQWDVNIGPTRTPRPTYMPKPTYTPRPSATPHPTYTPQPTYTLLPTHSPIPTETIYVPPTEYVQVTLAPGEGEISQFATYATASSEYTTTSWSAMQMVGAPDTPSCGDHSTAWASKRSGSTEMLLLSYDQAVIPTRIVIYESYNPDAVITVEVIDEAGDAISVYMAAPQIVALCPFMLVIDVKDVAVPVRKIRISIDQSVHGGWNEIDAVQLFGTPR
jgi:hypothetical protein